MLYAESLGAMFVTLCFVMLSENFYFALVLLLRVSYAVSHNADCRYAVCHHVKKNVAKF